MDLAFANQSQEAYAKYQLPNIKVRLRVMSDTAPKSPFVIRLEDEMSRAGIPDRAALSRVTGIPYHRLNPWFIRVNAKPNAEDLVTLARTLNVSGEYLIQGGERQPFNRRAALHSRIDRLEDGLQDELETFLDFLEQRHRQRRQDSAPE